jgi:hypothetical protein
MPVCPEQIFFKRKNGKKESKEKALRPEPESYKSRRVALTGTGKDIMRSQVNGRRHLSCAFRRFI